MIGDSDGPVIDATPQHLPQPVRRFPPKFIVTEEEIPQPERPPAKHLHLQKFTAEIVIRTNIPDAAIIRGAIAAGHDQLFVPEGMLEKVSVKKIRRVKE